MPPRTYATDVYLMCTCSECEGRQVRITLRKFRNLSRLPRQPATKRCTSSCREGMTRPGSEAKWLEQWPRPASLRFVRDHPEQAIGIRFFLDDRGRHPAASSKCT